MSLKAMSWVYSHSPYEGAAFTVHLTLADSVNDDHDMQFFMRQSKLAQKCRVSRNSVNKAIRRFLADGLLELVTDNTGSGRDDANVYRFVMPEDQTKVYDNTTRSGKPGDGNRESLQARKARDYQLDKQRAEHEAANPSLLDADLFEDPTFADYAEVEPDDSPQATVLPFPSAGDAEDEFSEGELVEGELVEDGHDDLDLELDAGDPEDAPIAEVFEDSPLARFDGKVNREILDQFTLQQIRDLLPDQIVPVDQAGVASQITLHYYIKWRDENGLGKLQIKGWAGQIGAAVKRLVAGNKNHETEGGGPIPPSVACDAVMAWHDRSVAKVRREKDQGKAPDPLQPGAIVTIGRTMFDPDTQKHGADGQGTTYRHARDAAARDGLDAAIDVLHAMGE